jgi:hypothetical protein
MLSHMRAALILFAATALITTVAAAAPPPDDATMITARTIAKEGLDLYDGGKYQEALGRFMQADALVHAPTMLLMAARSLDKLGRLVEAAEKYAAASQMVIDEGASDAFRAAVVNAGTERAALVVRIPSVVIIVAAPVGATPALKIDGVAISTTAAGQKKLVDPGAHSIEASASGVVATASVTLKEGESQSVELSLVPAGSPSSPSSPSSPLRTVGWVAIGVGAAGVVLGAVTGGLALERNSQLAQLCGADGFCPAGTKAVEGYSTLQGLAGAGLIAGGLVLAGGAVLVLAAPKPAPAAAGVRWSPWIGPGSAGLRGTF